MRTNTRMSQADQIKTNNPARFVKVIVPATLPYMFTGYRLSLGIAWLVIVASEMLTGSDIGVKVHIYEGNNMELGALCGKPFSVSALAVIDKGTSNILTL